MKATCSHGGFMGNQGAEEAKHGPKHGPKENTSVPSPETREVSIQFQCEAPRPASPILGP